MITETYCLPTGKLFVGKYSKGLLETLSIGDYGRDKNVKADFLGYTRELNGVPNGVCLPLSEKWVVTVSTQYGCPMKCEFCDVPNVKFKGNATFDDLYYQVLHAIKLYPEIKYTERLNLHFARMGEPIFNENVFAFSEYLINHKAELQYDTGLRVEVLHPVLTTSLPRKFKRLEERLNRWCGIKNHTYNGQAGLQISVNSTDEAQRDKMFRGLQLPLKDFAQMAEHFEEPLGRKYCLNFAYATGFEVDANKLSALFDPEMFMVKITPIHNNNACEENHIKTLGGYETYQPYRVIEENLKAAGFDVLVFVPSQDEENTRITCGNAVLGGSKVKG